MLWKMLITSPFAGFRSVFPDFSRFFDSPAVENPVEKVENSENYPSPAKS